VLRYAVISLIICVIAGGVGLANVSVIAKRISLVLFALFFLGFLALLGFAYLVGEAINHSQALWPPVWTAAPLVSLSHATVAKLPCSGARCAKRDSIVKCLGEGRT
jgi:hypothetical protein